LCDLSVCRLSSTIFPTRRSSDLHEALGVMGIVQLPARHWGAGDTVVKIFGTLGKRQCRDVPSITVSCDQQLILGYPRLALQPFGRRDIVLHLPIAKFAVHQRHALFAKMPRRAVVDGDLDDAFICPVLVSSPLPSIANGTGVGSSINTEN